MRTVILRNALLLAKTHKVRKLVNGINLRDNPWVGKGTRMCSERKWIERWVSNARSYNDRSDRSQRKSSEDFEVEGRGRRDGS